MNLEKEKKIMEICTDGKKISGRKLKSKIMGILFDGLIDNLARSKSLRSSEPLRPTFKNNSYSIKNYLK